MGFIGLITHANTQGDIPNHIVDEMIAEPFNVDGITLFGYIGKQVVLIRN